VPTARKIILLAQSATNSGFRWNQKAKVLAVPSVTASLCQRKRHNLLLAPEGQKGLWLLQEPLFVPAAQPLVSPRGAKGFGVPAARPIFFAVA